MFYLIIFCILVLFAVVYYFIHKFSTSARSARDCYFIPENTILWHTDFTEEKVKGCLFKGGNQSCTGKYFLCTVMDENENLYRVFGSDLYFNKKFAEEILQKKLTTYREKEEFGKRNLEILRNSKNDSL